MADFLQSLRSNGIFNPSGGGGNLLGPPDMSGGNSFGNANDIMASIMHLREQAKQADENRQYRMMTFQNDMNRRNKTIDQKEADRRAMFTPNTAVRWPDEEKGYNRMTAYQAGQLANEKDKTALARETAKNRDANADEDRGIRQQRADTYSNMHDLSDAEKLDIVNRARRGDIEARGMIEAGLLDKRAGYDMNKQNDQQMFLAGMEGVKGQQNLAEIAAKVAGEKSVAGYKSTLPTNQNPNFERTGDWNKAQEIINTNPELAPFIQLGTGGQFTITPPGTNFWGSQTGPTTDQYNTLKNSIYGTPLPNAKPGDARATTLPADKNTDRTVTPLTTPKANNGSTSKYKVTIK